MITPTDQNSACLAAWISRKKNSGRSRQARMLCWNNKWNNWNFKCSRWQAPNPKKKVISVKQIAQARFICNLPSHNYSSLGKLFAHLCCIFLHWLDPIDSSATKYTSSSVCLLGLSKYHRKSSNLYRSIWKCAITAMGLIVEEGHPHQHATLAPHECLFHLCSSWGSNNIQNFVEQICDLIYETAQVVKYQRLKSAACSDRRTTKAVAATHPHHRRPRKHTLQYLQLRLPSNELTASAQPPSPAAGAGRARRTKDSPACPRSEWSGETMHHPQLMKYKWHLCI